MAALALRGETRSGLLLAVLGIALLAAGALVPEPTGGGLEAVAAGFAILGGFSALLLGAILFLLGTRV